MASWTFVPAGTLAEPRSGQSAVRLNDGRVLIVGGSGDTTAELFDPVAKAFVRTGELSSAPYEQTATLLADGRVLVLGGMKEALLYSPNSGLFSRTGDPVLERLNHTATLLPDGRVLITGGRGGLPGQVFGYLRTAEIYDPTKGRFVATGSMSTAREHATATLLRDGRVLIVGGDQGDTGDKEVILISTEIYDPATGRFTAAGPLQTARTGHTASLLPDGRVLVAGGWNFRQNAELSSTEVFDPSTGLFTPGPEMATARTHHAACVLADGHVLIAGGYNADHPFGVTSAEVFDPASFMFVGTASMSEARFDHSAILLTDGGVLIVGGADSSTAELYSPS